MWLQGLNDSANAEAVTSRENIEPSLPDFKLGCLIPRVHHHLRERTLDSLGTLSPEEAPMIG